MDIPITLLCVFAGGLGGVIKSILEHNGSIMLPDIEDRKIVVLGTIGDVLGGMAIGWVSTERIILDFVNATDPSFALAFFLGIGWMPFIQAVLSKFGMVLGGGSIKLTGDRKNKEVPTQKKLQETNLSRTARKSSQNIRIGWPKNIVDREFKRVAYPMMPILR